MAMAKSMVRCKLAKRGVPDHVTQAHEHPHRFAGASPEPVGKNPITVEVVADCGSELLVVREMG